MRHKFVLAMTMVSLLVSPGFVLADTLTQYMSGLDTKVAQDNKLVKMEEASHDKDKDQWLKNLRAITKEDTDVYSFLNELVKKWGSGPCDLHCQKNRNLNLNAGLSAIAKKDMFFTSPIGTISGIDNIKIAFAISSDNWKKSREQINRAITLGTYARKHGIPAKIDVVLYSYGVKNITKEKVNHEPVKGLISRALHVGIKFYVCKTAMVNSMLIPALMPDFVHYVPLGMLELIKLDKQGFTIIQ